MTLRKTLPSNNVGLSIAEEVSPGVLPSEQAVPAANLWRKLDPNSYKDFGAKLDLVARNPISQDRQPKKGVIVGLEAMGGFVNDFTFNPVIQDLLAAFCFSHARVKNDQIASAVDADDGYTVTDGTGYHAGDLMFVYGATNPVNNGIKTVTGADGTHITAAGLADEAGSTPMISRVGITFAAGDASIDATVNGLPKLVTVAKDLTTLGLIPGEIVFLGGDAAGDRFANVLNAGWCRILSIAAHAITFDKTDTEMVDDAGAGKSIKMFFGRVIKNEVGTLITPRTFRLERQLGAPDLAHLDQIQADYLVGSACDQIKFVSPEKNKITIEFDFMSQDYATRKASDGPIEGTRPELDEYDAFSSSGDMRRQRIAAYPASGANTAAPTPLFGLINTFDFTIDNNLSMNNAQRFIGAVSITEGSFTVSGKMNAYFVGVEATQMVRDNADITFDFAMWKNNKGFAVDMPMIALGDGTLDVAQNKPVMIGLDKQASTGAKYSKAMNHTILMVVFDYLPNFASRRVD